MSDPDPTKNYKEEDQYSVGNLQIAAYMFAGLAMMLNIRLSYSAAPFALLRFKLPENLFSVFVRTTSSALELWCIPSMLIGNVMEQAYNKTQNKPSTHANNLKNSSIKDKAGKLKTTVGTHSTSELTNTKNNDLEGNDQKGTKLHTKAGILASRASELNRAAQSLESADKVGGTLKPLQQAAEKLKTAAGNDKSSGDTSLYGAANQLATYTSSGLELKVTKVIDAFEAVETQYLKLKNAVKEITIPSDKQKLVTAVDNAYSKLKSEYDGMLNLTKLKFKANDLQQAASDKLTTLQGPATTLVQAVKALRDQEAGKAYENAQKVIQNYEKVESAYNRLDDSKKQGDVKEKFEVLKTVYDSILNFTKVKHYSEQLETAATQLATNTENVEKVIINFNSVVTAYKALTDQSQVESEFEDLQKEYSNAIYFYKKYFLTWPSIATNWLNFLTFVILLIVFVTGGEQGHVTSYYWIMAISGFVFGINMVLVYAVDYRYLPFYMAGENSFPMVTSLILYFATSIFGNRRKYNSDYLVVLIDVSIAILIAFVASVLWTVAFYKYRAPLAGDLKPIWPSLISPIAMVIVGMGLVYTIYPGIAPGMIVPFYLIDKIEMVLLVATAFPPVIIAILRKYKENWSPSTKFLFSNFNMGGWQTYTDNDNTTTVHAWIWHFFDILIPIKILLAIIFIYSLHYRDSDISRSIINQPKMSTFLTITFYMCHEILLALGFPGMVGNGGAGGQVMLPVQYVGALLMVFLAFYSIGYITEYKRHDPSQWPTEGMTKWNALCYWLKMASKITNKNFKQLFTTDLRRDLLLCIQKNELI